MRKHFGVMGDCIPHATVYGVAMSFFRTLGFCGLTACTLVFCGCNHRAVSVDDFKSAASSLGFAVIDGTNTPTHYLLAKKNNCDVHS